MSKFWESRRAEVRNVGGVHHNHAQLLGLYRRYERGLTGDERRATARDIADRLESQATLFEASNHRLARVTTTLPSPAEYRAEAAMWRQEAGR